jgi:hypothetical protein
MPAHYCFVISGFPVLPSEPILKFKFQVGILPGGRFSRSKHD